MEYICKINEFVSRNESSEWGVLRYGIVGVSGTNYSPPIPTIEDTQKYIDEINNVSDPTLRAVIYFVSSTKKQLFWVGNKRTSIIVANAILISGVGGILTINKTNEDEYNRLLNNLYNSDESGLDISEPITKEFVRFCKDEIEKIANRFF